ncbi:MAG: RNA polymerase sigma-70 factor (ECF subfamily) [Pirellulaceae bacterium]|jgi:RNA polymerase sigma-70 factor (ECF subfamily)
MHPSPPETRASLILRLQDANDVAAWEEFVGIYSPVIFRVTVSRGFQAADAQDLVQEVLLAVARSVTQWLERTDRGSFRAWLLRIARNQAFDLINARSTRAVGKNGPEAEKMLADLPANSSLSSVLDFEYERAVFQWAAEQVRDVVAEHTWQAFWLTRVEGLSVDEAARKLDLRPGNIYFARSRVMARIKELVKQYEACE